MNEKQDNLRWIADLETMILTERQGAADITGTPTMNRTWELFCYHTVMRWPWSCYNRIAWPVFLWLLPWFGSEAYRRGEL